MEHELCNMFGQVEKKNKGSWSVVSDMSKII